MMKPGSILIVGRGPSAFDFDWSQVNCPVMAVSSGIFAIPRTVKVDHFVTLDEPKCYMAQLMNHCDNAWGNDARARENYWPFWTDPAIVKHIIEARKRTVSFIPIPFKEIISAIRQVCDLRKDEISKGEYCSFEDIRDAFYAEFGEHGVGHFGFQPGWGDYPNTRGWKIRPYRYPKWDGDGPLACWKQDDGESFINSLHAAVQIAARLGYKTLNFIGVDLLQEAGYGDTMVTIMKAWHKHAVDRGYEWFNLSPVSRLGEFVPGYVEAAKELSISGAIGEVTNQIFHGRKTKMVPIFQDGMMGFDIVPVEEEASV